MRIFVNALLAVWTALYVGFVDYEITSLSQLFSPDNAPFIGMVAILVFACAWGFQEMVIRTAKRPPPMA